MEARDVERDLSSHIRDSDKIHNDMQKDIIRLIEQGKADQKESDSRYDSFKEVKRAVLWVGALIGAGVIAAIMKAILK